MKATPLLSSLFICGVSTLAHLMFNSLLVLCKCGEKNGIYWYSNDAIYLLRPCKRKGKKGIVVYYKRCLKGACFQ